MNKKLTFAIVVILLVGLTAAVFLYFQNNKIAKEQKNIASQDSLSKINNDNKAEQSKSNLPKTTEYTTVDGVTFSYSDFWNLNNKSEKDISIFSLDLKNNSENKIASIRIRNELSKLQYSLDVDKWKIFDEMIPELKKDMFGPNASIKEITISNKLNLRAKQIKVENYKDEKGNIVDREGVFAVMPNNTVVDLFKECDISKRENCNKEFELVLNTLDFGALGFYNLGNFYYNDKKYDKAIVNYEKALGLEKERPTLKKEQWYILVDNLGMAYGISGNLDKSKLTFEYGIQKDATYPMFYYNIACTYAEMGDAQNAINNLNKAFEFKNNMIPGEKMPNPKRDSSFRNLSNNPEFLAVANKF